MFNFTALPPLSLYIHIPWCVKKCPYCDFNSHTTSDELPEQAYIDALIRDLEMALPQIWGRPITNIFIGGGTPSLFSADAFDNLFSKLRALLPIQTHAEITLEANPGTFEQQRFTDYRAIGINRLSIGIQSFNDDALQALGRIHNSSEAIKAVENARIAGFDNINLDLMFGLPNQTTKIAADDVAQAISLAPNHISYYQLTLEPNTLFHHHPPPLPEEDPIADWQQQGQDMLAAAGYGQYEVSAYACDKQQCRHNLNYWHFGDYLGIGAGAHSKISHAGEQSITRIAKQKQPQAYIDSSGTPENIVSEDRLKRRDMGFEFMLNALRLTDGFPTPLFLQHTGMPLSHIESALSLAVENGLLHRDIHRIQATPLGQRHLNTLVEYFLPP